MASLCGRPGCSEAGTVAYGMVPTDLVFWIAPLEQTPPPDARVLCQRHADAMVVPRGWTLDDRREGALRLFSTHQATAGATRRTRRPSAPAAERPEQLQIDGTGEIERPAIAEVADGSADVAAAAGVDHTAGDDAAVADPGPAKEWQPEFDHDDDLDGLLEVSSPLLARAFRGTDRPRR